MGVGTRTSVSTAATKATNSPTTAGFVAGVALLAILFVAYFCGGYVAGRMARFNGLRQGVAVWLWAVVIAVVVAIAAAAAAKYDVLATLNSFPRVPVNEGSLTTGGVIALLVAAVASLIGALAGGLSGMRFHRKVDKAGLGR